MIRARGPNRQRRNMRNYYSRELWEKAREPNAPFSAKIRAILYELQPISLDKLISSIQRFHVHTFIRSCLKILKDIAFFVIAYKKMLLIGSVLLYSYCNLVKFAHDKMDAGPMVVLLTALIAIFTIGLGDEIQDINGRVSAYSVFNRGFARMLGNVDAESLVAQHVGLQAPINNREEIRPNHIRIERDEMNNDDLLDNANEEEDEEGAERNNRPGPSRKSGKKARNRRTLESRRDRQRQREIAREIGFANDANINANDLAAINLALNEG